MIAPRLPNGSRSRPRLRIALISPKGPLYRHRGGIFKRSLRYAPLTLTTLAALFLSGLGVLLLCVGVFATRFWGYLITTHAFAQVYRMAYPDEIAHLAPPDSPLPPQTVPPGHIG